jgi:outer membrane protein assembly factor BamB
MNYNSFLDAWFGNGWFSYGIPFLVYIVTIVIVLSRSKGKEKKKKSIGRKMLTVCYYLIPFLILALNGEINPLLLGYGKPVMIKEIRYQDGKLVVLDYIRTSGGKTSSGQKCYRIHILDSETGEKKRRFKVGTGARLFKVHSDMVAISNYDNVSYYSVTTGKREKLYSKKTLPKLFPELSSGVDNLNTNADTETMEINTLDGNKWTLFTYTNKLIKGRPEVSREQAYVPTNKFRIDGDRIKLDDTESGTTFIRINTDESDHKYWIYNGEDLITYKDQFFLDGVPVSVNAIDSSFVILHYETVKKEKFILSCFTLNGSQKLWEIKQSQLNPTSKLKGEKVHLVTNGKGGKLFFTIAKEVFAISAKDGKVIWRQKL